MVSVHDKGQHMSNLPISRLLRGRGAVLLLTICAVPRCFAHDASHTRSAPERSLTQTERSAPTFESASKAKPRSAVGETIATDSSEVFRNILIAAGKTVSLDSAIDYSASNSVAVTVQCTICDTAATSLGTAGLVLQAWWLVDNADVFAATEMKAATAFPYWDAGSALFNVYGSQFRLQLQNKGKQTISIQQITFFRRSQ